MDLARGVLDNLMGRDRNLPKNSSQIRDHYSNSDVCKPYLICFCFNTLFPNTIYDEGPCGKRHDTYLKTMFDSDVGRSEFEKQYIKQCIAWIERRLQEVEQKTKKNLSTIEGKNSLSTQRPRQVLDRILSIDKDIEEMMRQAAVFGQNGQIDDSARCLEEVERLREQRKEVDLMGDNLLAVVKHQKICQICGAIQTINDTEKRIQMHLQGKIHQGFGRLRTQIQTLRVRLEIVQQKIDKEKEKNKQLSISQTENASEVKVEAQVIPQKHEEREREKEKIKQHHREKQKMEHQSDHKKKKKENKQHKHKDRDKSQKKKKDRQREQNQDRHRYDKEDRSRSRDKHKKKEKKKKDHDNDRRSRSYERDHRRRYD